MSTDLTVYLDRDDTFSVQIKLDGVILNLAGGRIIFGIKRDGDEPDAEAVVKKEVVIDTAEPTGEVPHGILRLSPSDKVNLNPVVLYSYDFLVLDGGARAIPCDDLSGKVTVIRTITRSAL